MEHQIIRWRHRYPELTDDDEGDNDGEVSLLTAQAVYDHLGLSKELLDAKLKNFDR